MTEKRAPYGDGTGVGIAELKAHLSECLREVQAGHGVTVLDRGRPIARIVPIEAESGGLVIRPAIRKLHSIPLPKPIKLHKRSSLEVLLEDREDRF